MSKLPLDKEQIDFILDCVENKGMSLAMVARKLNIDAATFYKKIKRIPEIEQYKKKITRGQKKPSKLTESLRKERRKILFKSDGSKEVDCDYSEEKMLKRTPRIIRESDMDLLEELVATGLPMRLVAKEIGIPNSTLYEYMNANPEFEERIRLGRAKHYKTCEEKVNQGLMDKSLYTYFSKTKWKDIFPQEDKHIQPMPVSVQGNLDIRTALMPEKPESNIEEE